MQRINLLSGILKEAGFEVPSGTKPFLRYAWELIEQPEVHALRGELQVVLAELN